MPPFPTVSAKHALNTYLQPQCGDNCPFPQILSLFSSLQYIWVWKTSNSRDRVCFAPSLFLVPTGPGMLALSMSVQ